IKLHYTHSFENNNVDILGLFAASNSKSSFLQAGRKHYKLFILQNSNEERNSMNTRGNITNNTVRDGFMSRVCYSYNVSYVITTTVRYDGNYYLSPSRRYGFFPSVSVGCRLTKEQFLRNVGWLSNLKLKASYGSTGAVAGSPFQYLSTYSIQHIGAALNG